MDTVDASTVRLLRAAWTVVLKVAVLDGDPFQPGFFSIRLKMPDGYRVAPHWHPTNENIVVSQGRFKIGMGDKYDDATARELSAGGFTISQRRDDHPDLWRRALSC